MADEAMSDERLAEIRQQVEAATPGPWEVVNKHSLLMVECPNEHGQRLSIGQIWYIPLRDDYDANAQFIAQARTYVPALLAEVERLRTEFTAASHLIVRLTEHAEDSTYYQPSALIQEARAWVDSHTSD